jgi:hypothetical protein
VQQANSSGQRTAIFSAHNVRALVPGSQIIVTHPTVTNRAANALQFVGLAPSGTRDAAGGSAARSTSPTATTTAATNQSNELVVGAIGIQSGPTFTPGAGFAAPVGANRTAGTVVMYTEYRMVTAIGTQTANGSLSGRYNHAVVVATYRADITAPLRPTLSATVPTSPANDNSPEITGTAEANSTVRLYTNSACSSTVAGSGSAAQLASGGIAVSVADNTTTTFFARATDQAGNISPCSTSSVSYTEDSLAPTVTITAPAEGSETNDTTPTLGGTASAADPGPVTVKVYAGADTSGSLVTTLSASRDPATGAYSVSPASALSDGTYTAQASQQDGAGNVGQSPARTFVVDTVAPATAIATSIPEKTPRLSAGFTFTSPDPHATFYCSLDGAAFEPCSSPQEYNDLALGQHTFEVRARDEAANIDTTPAVVSWMISPRKHARKATLKLRRHIQAQGKVTVADGFEPCANRVRVVVQREKGRRWVMVAKTLTTKTGRFEVKLRDKAGRYRAVVNKKLIRTSTADRCTPARSRPRGHRH